MDLKTYDTRILFSLNCQQDLKFNSFIEPWLYLLIVLCQYVGKPMRQEGDAKRRAKTLVTQKILKSIMLRRTKESRKELCLPTKIVGVAFLTTFS